MTTQLEALRALFLKAAVNCSHTIVDDSVELYRDRHLPGNALHQLSNRLEAALANLPTQPEGQADHTALLKMIAQRARGFPWFPLGCHLPEVFDALGEERPTWTPQQAQQMPVLGEQKPQQAIAMLITEGPGIDVEECGHWYSPDAVRAMLAAKAVPGYVLVPEVPTEGMLVSAHAAEHCGNAEPHFANAYRAMLQAAPPAPSVERVPQWQPIETAPKNFTKVLLHWSGAVVTGWWHTNNGKTSWEPRQNWCTDTGFGHDHRSAAPTHWMPLPEPPSPASSSKEGGEG